MNKKQPIEKEQCHTEDTEKEEKKKEKKTSIPSFVEAMMGVIMTDIKRAMKKQSMMQKPKECLGMLQIQVLFYRVLQREDSLV